MRATKFDGSPHWIQPFKVVSDDGRLLVARYRARTPIFTSRGEFRSQYDSRAYFWRDRWYNVFRLARHGCELALWYCNVAPPAVFECGRLAYTDLDLDVVVRPGGIIRVLDREDFERHRKAYGYPAEMTAKAESAACEIVALANAGAFPFDPAETAAAGRRSTLLVESGGCPAKTTRPTSSGAPGTV